MRCRYSQEVGYTICAFVSTLLAADELDMLRELMDNSLVGEILNCDALRSEMMSMCAPGMALGWTTDDGHTALRPDTLVLLVRALYALLEDDTDASRTALREWLPPLAELLRITEMECSWRGGTVGASHPALLCARLHGERLGSWETAAEVAEGVLAIEAFQPLLRTEALRLLARAKGEAGDRAAACEAAARGAAEAAGAGYVWLEMRSLDDALRWCAEGEAEGVRSRLRDTMGRLAVTEEDLAGVLGKGALG